MTFSLADYNRLKADADRARSDADRLAGRLEAVKSEFAKLGVKGLPDAKKLLRAKEAERDRLNREAERLVAELKDKWEGKLS